MRCYMLLTAGGPMVILTTSQSPTEPSLLAELADKGIDKFIAYEIPESLAKERYGAHFYLAEKDVHETDRLRTLDFNGYRSFKLFKFSELGTPVRYEAPEYEA